MYKSDLEPYTRAPYGIISGLGVESAMMDPDFFFLHFAISEGWRSLLADKISAKLLVLRLPNEFQHHSPSGMGVVGLEKVRRKNPVFYFFFFLLSGFSFHAGYLSTASW